MAMMSLLADSTTETFEEMIARQEVEHAERLAFIRARLAASGNRAAQFEGGNDLVYLIHPNAHEDRAELPWQVTTFIRSREDRDVLLACSDTRHKHLDLEEDHGCYYASAVWEIAWSVKMEGSCEPC
jgi:hypothetical protein